MAKKQKKRGPKPKPSDQVRKHSIPAVRFTEAEFKAIHSVALRESGSISEWVRTRLLEAAKRPRA